MNSYIIPNLDQHDRQMLHDHGVVFFPWCSDIITDDTQIKKALNLLGATATKEATEIPDVFQLTLVFDPLPAPQTSAPRMDRLKTTQPTKAHSVGGGIQKSDTRQRYVSLCSSRLRDLSAQAEKQIEDRKPKLASAQNAFVQTSRKHFVGSNKLTEDQLKRSFAEQFERLLSLNKVKTVRVTNGTILVYTETLFAIDPATGNNHELGRYLIAIDTHGNNDGVRWFNLTRRVRTVQPRMNAPRVFDDGKAVVDEVKETFLELIAQFEFATVAELAIQFVETVSDDPLSNFIPKWPHAAQEPIHEQSRQRR